MRHAQRSFTAYHAHAAFKTRAAAIIGMIGFPTFYAIWAFVLPQPYESLALRLLGFALSLAVFLMPRAPLGLRRHDVALAYLTLWYTVPFFFTFMLLKNDASTVWQLSIISGFVYLTLLCDAVNVVVLGLTGSLAAWLVFWATGGGAVPFEYYSVLPVLAFVICGVAFLNYTSELVIAEKMTAIGGLAAHVAHEMRTPLLGITLDAKKVQEAIPVLLAAHDWAKEHQWPGGRVGRAQREGLPAALGRIVQHAGSANIVIDMLLMNVSASGRAVEMKPCGAAAVVESALGRFNFRGEQRQLVSTRLEPDFVFRGVGVLMEHVLFNLLKNALRAIEKAGAGAITIELRRLGPHNEIVFADTGPGMAADVQRNIFLPFYSAEAIGIGTGVGLAFCRDVVESFGGTITCASALGVGTTFVVNLPAIAER